MEGVTDSACACAPQTFTPLRIQRKDVVTMARMVPVGIDFWASLRSPDRFEPAMMPAERGGQSCQDDAAVAPTAET